MTRTAIINVVGLTNRLIGTATPNISALVEKAGVSRIDPVIPAVTCTAQSTYLTGLPPSQHGIVGNGWYNRELTEVQFWKQSNHLVHGRKLWEEMRTIERSFTCAKLFWWYNMYSTADYSITPRPLYPADGRKVFDIYTYPFSIRPEIKNELGEFPFPTFWGPAAGVNSPQGSPSAASEWIAESAKWIEQKYQPTLSLSYLPHLDYNLQRLGPGHASIANDCRAIDEIVGGLIDFFRGRGVQVILLSEYGITPVNQPIHLNRLFRQNNWIAIKDELGLELLDAGASKVFAVADHQVAHIYLNDASVEKAARDVISRTPGIARVLGRSEQAALGIDHARSGDLIALAHENAWFTYYYWLDDALAPDFARTVDIHRKPGYDPVELFLDPTLKFPKLKIVSKLLRKKLGFRMLMDLIPLDATLVKGSHGIRPAEALDFPVIISEKPDLLPGETIPATEVYNILKAHIAR